VLEDKLKQLVQVLVANRGCQKTKGEAWLVLFASINRSLDVKYIKEQQEARTALS
jgi:hypothetical protein